MISVEWVQKNLDIMAPAILIKMGSISSCFTHKDTNGPQKLFPKNSFPKVLPPRWLTSNGCKQFLRSLKLPQQVWEKRAAFRPVLHTKIPMAPKILPQTSFPKILLPKWLTSNGCKKLFTSPKLPQPFWEKRAAFRPVLHTKIPMAPKSLPQNLFPKSSSPPKNNIEWVQTNLDIMAATILRKKGSISPCFTHKDTNGPNIHPQKFVPKSSFPQLINIEWLQTNLDIMGPPTKIPMAPKILPQEFFPKSSSPKIINIEWAQKSLDIMAPAILRKMGSISPCFTHKDTNGPKHSSPRILSQKFFPQNY